MIKSYLKIAWRNLLRKKGYSLINIGGLALGMTVAFLIGLWIDDEWSFNQYHKNYHSIAQVYRKETWSGETEVSTPQVTGLGTLLKTDYGNHFKDVVMVRNGTVDRVIEFEAKKFTESGYFMQSGGPEMLTLKMISGRRDGLKDMKSILLSASLAKKFFNEADPLGQTILMDAKSVLTVTGVYEDLPKNSEFRNASYLAPLDLLLEGESPDVLNSWNNYFINIYVQLKPDSDLEQVSVLLKNATQPFIDDETKAAKQQIFLHPMSDWHLNSEWENGIPVQSSRMMTVVYFGIIGVFVLILACINFMNLSTARSESRAKEVGIRKTVGSNRSQLIQQFYGESFLVSILAFILSIVMVELMLPIFNAVADKAVGIPWTKPGFWMLSMAFVMVSATLAGSYPALYLSSFRPARVLKGSFKAGPLSALPRKFLVVVQFTVSIALVIGTITIYQQIQYAKDRPVGYSRAGLIELRSAQPEFAGKYAVLHQELKRTGVVEDMAEANYSVTDTRGWNHGFSWQGQQFEPAFNTIFVTPEYGNTVGWEFIAGRDFSREIASDSAGIVINESALRILGLKTPIGEELRWAPGGTDRGTFKILGVVKDMVKGSPYEETFPSIIFYSKGDQRWLYIRMSAMAKPHEALPKIESVLTHLIPSAPFEYTFLDDKFAQKFQAEERVGKIAFFISTQAILISCLGLFGLASFLAEKRTKEIGIRKVLGATVLSLWKMLSKDFIVLITISCVIAIPISFYFMSAWLENYQYRTDLSIWIFLYAIAGSVVVTLITISFQTIKAALTNPVNSLRSE